jgi:hypothetical protein
MRDLARRLERQRDELAEALRELVRLKSLHDRTERRDFGSYQLCVEAIAEYVRCKPLAWDRARALLARIDGERT